MGQARRRSSVTGRGDRKDIWGAQINVTIIFGSEDQKKRSSSWPVAYFWGTSLARGGTFTAWWDTVESYGADLASCSLIQGWNKILLTLGVAQAVFWGGTGPERHSCGTGPVAFLGGTTLAWGAHFLLGTHSPEIPPWRRAWGGRIVNERNSYSEAE